MTHKEIITKIMCGELKGTLKGSLLIEVIVKYIHLQIICGSNISYHILHDVTFSSGPYFF